MNEGKLGLEEERLGAEIEFKKRVYETKENREILCVAICGYERSKAVGSEVTDSFIGIGFGFLKEVSAV